MIPKNKRKALTARNRTKEAGNVFLFILLGIVLFAAVSYVMSRGFRTTGTDQISDRRAELAATEIMDFSQRVERAISKIRSKGISESDISLEHDGNFINTNCNDAADTEFPDCQVFNASGGRVTVLTPPEGANDGTGWHFTGATCIEDSSNTTCETDGISNEEILMILPNLRDNVCSFINKKLNITGIPAATGTYSATAFTGSFADDSEIIIATGPYDTACYSDGTNNQFYFTLIKR